MGQFIENIGSTWISLNQEASIAVGEPFKVQNRSTTWAIIQESVLKPDDTNNDGEYVTDLFHTEPSKVITAGSSEVWIKSTYTDRTCAIFVQEI